MMPRADLIKNNAFLILLFVVWTRFALRSEAFLTRKSISASRDRSSIQLKAKWKRRYVDEDGRERERSTERPTLPATEVIGPPAVPSKPKILVLGASGKIGSSVVRQLLEMSHLDVTVVAFVRDYDKACRVLYDDVLVARQTKKRGPQLQIVVGDLVPPEELPGFVDEDEELWAQTAQSAANFYGNDVADYDNRHLQPDVNEALQEAVKGCTSIISCVGAVRPTNVWSDYLVMPFWRLFRHDVSSWCRDPKHPYYVHYASTRKVLGFAEREQLRREAMAAVFAEEDERQPTEIPRIRFVRISDLCVTQRPWEFIPLVTNALHSMVFRYQDITERLLEESKVLDTVILRPGDLVDEERDVNTTALQVDASGKVPCPARVGREDVAELAISAVMFQARNVSVTRDEESSREDSVPLKMTLGVRWVGEDLDPYPSQGCKSDGLPDAHQCMTRALKQHRKNEQKRKRRRKLKTETNIPNSVARYASSRQRSIKPYGIFVAVPVYFLLWVMLTNMCRYIPYYHATVAPALSRIRSAAGVAIMGRVPSVRSWLRGILKKSSGKSFISF